jgi:hypothetical protein
MGGLVLDIAVMFIFRSLVRIARFLSSLGWSRNDATVLDATVIDPDMGCPSVKIHYQVVSNGRTQQGEDQIPFFLRTSAKSYARSLAEKRSIVVRINPANPRQTLFTPSDQKRSSAPITVR